VLALTFPLRTFQLTNFTFPLFHFIPLLPLA
jgi:hypothetical protein